MRQSTSHIDPHRRLSDGPGEPLDVASGVFGHGRPADLAGITERLDHLTWLGADALWLSPFYRSPMRDFGYDVADYTNIHPMFGTMADFDGLLADVHGRGLKLILDLVPNHTSDQHPWFARAKKAKPGSNHRDYYVWSDTAEKYKDALIRSAELCAV
mgnify:CR=1 FL=1